MKLLLDTHVLLWALGNPKRLGATVRNRLSDPATELAVSAVTIWEVAIKRALGKLRVPGSASAWLMPAVDDLGASWLPITPEHAAAVEELPPHHRDPFDRMLVAQALAGGWTIASADEAFEAYPVALLHV
ncbi:MAG: type II toxin-antitoxin system VapC family toxin [Deltaproteobacteria bacterium]|nr:type II toxin-antitoxin system VapC family toxin [Nannocystaceae bacterium]